MSQAPNALLTYSCIPTYVPVSQPGRNPVYVDLLIAMTNGTDDPVVCQAVAFALPIGQDVGCLSNQAGTITAEVLNAPNWHIQGDGTGHFTAQPDSPVTLQPNAGVNFRLRGIVVSPLTGLVVVNAYEQTAPVGQAFDARQGSAELVKQQTGLAITSFVGNPVSVTAGQTCTLSWTTNGADHCILSWDGQSVSGLPANGTYPVTPQLATTYTLTAAGGGGSTFSTLPVPVPVSIALQAPAGLVPIGGLATLSWKVTGATTATLSPVEDGQPSLVAPKGSRDVHPTATATYTLSASSPNGGTATATATVNVQPLPVIKSFSASTDQPVPPASGVTLSWDTENGDTVTITPNVGTVAGTGQVVVKPAQTTTYTLTCANLNGPTTRTAVVTVGAMKLLDFYLAPSSDGSGGTSAYWSVWGAATFGMGIFMNYSIGCKLMPQATELVEVRLPNLQFPYYGQFFDATGKLMEVDVYPYQMGKRAQAPTYTPDTPRITYFWSTPDPILQRGVQDKTLAWSFSGASTGVINPGGHVVSPTGTLLIHVDQDTTYTLTVTGAGGTTATASVRTGNVHAMAAELHVPSSHSLR